MAERVPGHLRGRLHRGPDDGFRAYVPGRGHPADSGDDRVARPARGAGPGRVHPADLNGGVGDRGGGVEHDVCGRAHLRGALQPSSNTGGCAEWPWQVFDGGRLVVHDSTNGRGASRHVLVPVRPPRREHDQPRPCRRPRAEARLPPLERRGRRVRLHHGRRAGGALHDDREVAEVHEGPGVEQLPVRAHSGHVRQRGVLGARRHHRGHPEPCSVAGAYRIKRN
mmetsp:Transcript_125476/g.354964  ORF Transcript_125476/g.354964 Transcript_125476/m.354964 type:complete len:224 (+) Transcript_125476:776-1447(+)